MKKNSNTKYEQLKQQKMRDEAILENIQKSNENNTPYKYSEEQMLAAQSQSAQKQINELYDEKIFKTNNNILYLVYYFLSLIALPLLYFGKNVCESIIGFWAYLLLIVILITVSCIEKMYHNNMDKQPKFNEYLNDFANDTSIFCYALTSLGYFGVFLNVWQFAVIYCAMLLFFIIAFYYKIIKPLWYDFRRRKIS